MHIRAMHARALILAGLLALPAMPVSARPSETPRPGVLVPDTTRQRIERFNRSLAQEPQAWRQDPLLLALIWVGPAAGPQRTISYKAEPAENPQKATVLVTEEGLFDDSISASRASFYFVRSQGRWVLADVRESWRCRRGPNTRDYRPTLCP